MRRGERKGLLQVEQDGVEFLLVAVVPVLAELLGAVVDHLPHPEQGAEDDGQDHDVGRLRRDAMVDEPAMRRLDQVEQESGDQQRLKDGGELTQEINEQNQQQNAQRRDAELALESVRVDVQERRTVRLGRPYRLFLVGLLHVAPHPLESAACGFAANAKPQAAEVPALRYHKLCGRQAHGIGPRQREHGMFGYHGCYLRIDLTRGTVDKVSLAEDVLRRFLGGVGLATWLMHREAPPGVDPLAPEAPLIFSLSPLVGTPLTTSAKFAVV